MFESLSERLQSVFQKLKGRGKLSESDVESALREVRLALLEADVNFKVVKEFLAKVKERAVGQEVLRSLSPAQQVIKIVYEELAALMGGSQAKLDLGSKAPATILMAGLQGSGKTTFTAKLALRLKGQGKRPLMVAGDIYRPAAIRQLEVLGQQIGVPVFQMGTAPPAQIAKAGLEHARRHGNDVLLMDTAGRLHVDEELMAEIEELKAVLDPSEILLVVDAMTGQDAVNVAESFHRRLGLTGVVLTKLDGDARGGAALSIKAVTGAPVKFVGVGEKLTDLEAFHPDRVASRILGMGDVLSLIEKAEAALDAEKSKAMVERIAKDAFTLEDFREQLRQVRSMGPLDQLLGMLPGMGNVKALKDLQIDEAQLNRIEAIINSMTKEERANPSIIDGSRRRRIALGSGTRVQDVNRLLKQFEQTKAMMRHFVGPGSKKGRRLLGNLFRG